MKGKKDKRALRNPPGKLLTGKGPIPGDLGAFGTVWGKFNVTGDQAERMMGFRPKEGAIGVVLSRRKYTDKNGKVKKGIFASSLMPRKPTMTEKLKATHERMRIMRHIVHKYHADLIVPIWNPLIKDDTKKPYTGYHYFMSWNLKHVGTALNWKNLLISNGPLRPIGNMCTHWYDPDTKEIKIYLPLTINYQPLTIHQIGIGIIDTITGDFFHIAPAELAGLDKSSPYILTWKLENIRKNYKPRSPVPGTFVSRFYIYMYYRRQNSSFGFRHSDFTYSSSRSSRIRFYKYYKERKYRTGKNTIIIKVEN